MCDSVRMINKQTELCMRIIILLSMLFLTAANLLAQKMDKNKPYPEFSLGISGIYATIEKSQVIIQKIADNSPASGKFQKGDVIEAVNGKKLNIEDPRPLIGQALNEADGSGKFIVTVSGKNIPLTFPKIGSFSSTWPINCKKSDLMIKQTAEFIIASQQKDGSYRYGNRAILDDLTGCLTGLFLLSTGNDTYLKNVKLQAHQVADKALMRPTGSNWHLGYQGIFLAEYYLRTGDNKVLKGLENLCRQAEKYQAAGGWGHGGQINSPGYVQSGLMNSAGLPVLTTLIMAKECGVAVNPESYRKALEFGIRFAGRGCAPYGDHRPELDWSNTNGRNGMLATALNLLPETEYKMAAQHFAMMVADSYFQPEFGHTGGGFNVIWRGMASSLIPGSKKEHYHRQLNKLAWYYDLARLPGGGFTILPTPPNNQRYSDITWGTGAIGLTYTAPLRTLRITGGKPTRYSKISKSPSVNFGTKEDLKFLITDNASGYGKDEYEPHEIYDMTIGSGKEKATSAQCLKLLHHYSPLVRNWAIKRLNQVMDNSAIRELKKMANHSDPRVRRAVFDTISGYTNWGRPFRSKINESDASSIAIKSIENVIGSSQAAWWEIDGALFALSKCKTSDIRKNINKVLDYSKHPDWYLRESAFWCIAGLGKEIEEKEINLLANIYKNSERAFVRSSYDAGFNYLFKNQKAKLEGNTEKDLMSALGYSTHSPRVAEGYGEGALHEATHRTMMILSKFDFAVYKHMTKDIQVYLDSKWLPYFQHSVWLIKGSKWQPGFVKVMNELGPDGKPIRDSFVKILKNFSSYDKNRMKKHKGQELEDFLTSAVKSWDSKYGR